MVTCMEKKVSALILAAGYSSRMGTLKALLPFDGEPAIERLIKCFYSAGIEDIFVVVGHQADKIKEAVKKYNVNCVYNAYYDEGMFTSVQIGIHAIAQRSFLGTFLMPVDHPLIQPFTLETMLERFYKGCSKIIYPCYQVIKGHPPLFSSDIFKEIFQYKGNEGLRGVLAMHQHEAELVETGNPTCLMDMDTNEDYLQALNYFLNHLPDPYECEYLYNRFNVSEDVLNHCRKVADTAKAIAVALCQKGVMIDLNVVYCGGLLHDIYKGTQDHAKKAANLMLKLGYPRLIAPIENHMDISEQFAEKICDESVLYLADKIVYKSDLISLMQRWNKIPEEKKDYAEIKLNKAMHIQRLIEDVLETPLFQVLEGAVS